MKTYVVTGVVTISVYTRVRAGSPAQAVKIARRRPMMGLTRDGGTDECEAWVADELDGEPQNVRVDA